MKLKRTLAIMLSIILALSAFPAIVFAEEFDATAEVTSITDQSTLRCVVEITNQSEVSGYVTVYKSVFGKAFDSYSMVKEKIAVPAGKGATKKVTIYQDYDGAAGEYAMMHFWMNDTMNPVCDSVLSTEVAEGVINADEIEITTDMVFASSEAEGDHRVTAIADDDLGTYWSAKGVTRSDQQSVTAFLDAEYSINKVGVAFGSGSSRQYVFTVLTSMDGRNYTTVLDETVSELSDEIQYFNVEETIGKYLRVNIVERVEPDSNNWVTITEIEAFGTLIGEDVPVVNQSFEFDDAVGTRLPTAVNSSVAGGWIATSMDERNYSGYTPSLGDELYADIANLPNSSERALHLYDNVGRTTDETNGAGGMLVAKQYETAPDRGRYNISFKLYVPTNMENGEANSGYWSGFSLTDELVSGGNDLSHYAALQIRMDNTDEGVVAFTDGSKVYAVNDGRTDAVDPAVGEYIPASAGVKMADGAQVRVGDGVDEATGKVGEGSGLRFITTVDYADSLASLEGAQFGVKITAEGSDAEAVDIPATLWQAEGVYTSAITNLAEGNFNRSFTATPYITIDGQTFTTDGVTRSVYQVARGLLAGGFDGGYGESADDSGKYDELSEELLAVLNAYVNQTGIRLSFSTEGLSAYSGTKGAYTGDGAFFEVSDAKVDGTTYTIKLNPVGQAVINTDIATEYVRINNNNSAIKTLVTVTANSDGTYTLTFDAATLIK